jgi:hypothetical protein
LYISSVVNGRHLHSIDAHGMLRQDLPVRLGPEPWPVQRDFIFLFGAHKLGSHGKGRDYIRDIFKKRCNQDQTPVLLVPDIFSLSGVQMNICFESRVHSTFHPFSLVILEGIIYFCTKVFSYRLGSGWNTPTIDVTAGRHMYAGAPFGLGSSHGHFELTILFGIRLLSDSSNIQDGFCNQD